MEGHPCANCGVALHGPFCAACGQSEHDGHGTTVAHLLHELTHEVAHVDGKIGRTVLALFLQPGRLTAEYWTGRRASWIRPFRVFLIAAAAHVLLVHGIGPMNLQTRLQRSPDGSLDVAIGASAERPGRPGAVAVPDQDAERYVERLRRTYVSVRYLAVPVFALAAFGLYRRRQPFYANHVVFGAHFYAFWYAVSIVASLAGHSMMVGTAAALVSAVYIFLALRRLFGDSVIVTASKTAVLYVVMMGLELGLALTAALWVARQA